MDPRVAPLAETLRLNSRLFGNCLDSLSDEQSRLRPAAGCNNAAFVAAHLADSRYFLLKTLGAERPNPLARYVGGWKGIDELTEWPSLEETRAAWAGAGAALDRRLGELTAADLDAASSLGFPVETKTLLGILSFLVAHDSYHIGQLSLLRRQCGLPAMRYT
ncbi:MAG: DinB family protein [Gemmatimonadales bacterium]